MTGRSFAERVVAAIEATAPGDVVTYGEIAAEAGAAGAARAVGTILARSGGGLPWWRVVNAQGRLAPGKERDQATRLRAEGVAVEGGRVRGFGRTPATVGVSRARRRGGPSRAASKA
ncbi:MAG TPA: MGMT family protein [Acidimicrobiales bacterium]|nr:MGMT family protein [Acidimicrobiales bacterium]